jgi:hypothetical protein
VKHHQAYWKMLGRSVDKFSSKINCTSVLIALSSLILLFQGLLVNKNVHALICWMLLSFWLLASCVSVHAHVCFDGQEPPVSIHLQMVDGHDDHHPQEVHDDQDIELQQWVIAKITKLDFFLPLLIAVTLLLLLITAFKPFFIYSNFYLQSPSGLRPSVRAPPVFSA